VVLLSTLNAKICTHGYFASFQLALFYYLRRRPVVKLSPSHDAGLASSTSAATAATAGFCKG
jgi:hypothetical protein